MVLSLLQQPLFQCHFYMSSAFSLVVPTLVSAIPPLLPPPPPPCLLLPLLLLLCLLPLSCLPLLPPSLDICCCVPQLKFRNTVNRNFYLPHSSAFLRTHGQIISSSVFIKNKIQKPTLTQNCPR